MNERLRRLLLVVPAASARPGIPLVELAAMLACTPDELRKDIDLLAQVGAPPFSPDDLIDIELRGERVYVSLPQSFGKPTRLTATEAAALAAAARALAPGDAVLERAVEKLAGAIAPVQRPLYDGLLARLAVLPEETATGVDAAIERAIRERRVLEMLYFARSELAARPRPVRPRAIGTIDGVRYLSAVNAGGGERLYRLDRIAEATVTAESFAALPPIDLAAELSRVARLEESATLAKATVRFSKTIAAAARARHPGARETDDGIEAAVPYSTLPWLVSYVLSWGGEADVVEPAEARAALREAVQRAFDNHAD